MECGFKVMYGGFPSFVFRSDDVHMPIFRLLLYGFVNAGMLLAAMMCSPIWWLA